MRVTVLAFATAADALGGSERVIELPAGSDLAALRAALEGERPALAALWGRLAVAVDGRLAAGEATRLAEGCEVALLPPVSGGIDSPEGVPPDRGSLTGLVDGPLPLAELAAAVGHPSCGAVVTFLGTVREQQAGRGVGGITYSGYRAMAETVLRAICADLEAASPGLRVAIVHRLGHLRIGEASVAIAAASPHRAAAYEASRTALERLKREAPIWKREHYADGSSAWREEEALAVAALPVR